jgi:hypothetical protein
MPVEFLGIGGTRDRSETTARPGRLGIRRPPGTGPAA